MGKWRFKYWIRENWMPICSVLIAVGCLWISMKGFASPESQSWLKKPASNITCGDILIIAIVHAWINKSNSKK